jgi:chromosome segregation ATPase
MVTGNLIKPLMRCGPTLKQFRKTMDNTEQKPLTAKQALEQAAKELGFLEWGNFDYPNTIKERVTLKAMNEYASQQTEQLQAENKELKRLQADSWELWDRQNVKIKSLESEKEALQAEIKRLRELLQKFGNQQEDVERLRVALRECRMVFITLGSEPSSTRVFKIVDKALKDNE